MLHCSFELATDTSGGSKVIAAGIAAGEGLAGVARSVLDSHRDEISAVGGFVGDPDDGIVWGIESWTDTPLADAGVLVIGASDTVRIPVECHTACPDHPDVAAPKAQLVIGLRRLAGAQSHPAFGDLSDAA